MRKALQLVILVVASSLVILPQGGIAFAEEMKMVGVITKIEIAGADAKSATATLKDVKSGESVTVIVSDDLTLDKFKDHRIVEGDEIRCRYEVKDGRNISKYFRKTAGC